MHLLESVLVVLAGSLQLCLLVMLVMVVAAVLVVEVAHPQHCLKGSTEVQGANKPFCQAGLHRSIHR